MTVEEIERGVQFTVDSHSNVTSVVVAPDLWRKILHVLEDAENREIAEMLHERATVGPMAISTLGINGGEDWA